MLTGIIKSSVNKVNTARIVSDVHAIKYYCKIIIAYLVNFFNLIYM